MSSIERKAFIISCLRKDETGIGDGETGIGISHESGNNYYVTIPEPVHIKGLYAAVFFAIQHGVV